MKKLLLTVLMVIGVSVCVFASDYSGEWFKGGKTYRVVDGYSGVYVLDDKGVVLDNATVEKIDENCIVVQSGSKKMKLTRKKCSRECEIIMGGSGFVAGATAGAIWGSEIGIALGPLGAIAGTIPGAVIGGIIGGLTGGKIGSEIDRKDD